jgi:hypothetical protein
VRDDKEGRFEIARFFLGSAIENPCSAKSCGAFCRHKGMNSRPPI